MTASTERVPAERAMRGRYPDFFIVGHAKSGTTALYETLRRHPQIYMPGVKEPQFFARNPDAAAAGRSLPAFEKTGRHTETVEQYLSLFSAARADQRVGEASTFYLWSELAPGRIAEVQPAARIIAILREPASFLRSLHMQMVQNNSETEKDLRRALALEPLRRQGRKIPRNAHWPRALMYSERVRYVEQLRRYHDLFPREQVLVLIYDDFNADNDATVRRVLRFLEVDDQAAPAVARANPTVAVRSPRLDIMTRSVGGGRGPVTGTVKAVLRGLTTHRVRRELLHPVRRRLVFRDPPAPDEALIAELRSRFRDEVVSLGEYLDRDLVSLWGYEHVS
jgi:sulfotransferase family protein